MKKLILLPLFGIILIISCASTGMINLTDIPDNKLSSNQNTLITSKLKFSEKNKNCNILAIDNKEVPPHGLYVLIPGKHTVKVKIRKSEDKPFLIRSTTVRLNRGSTHSLNVSLSRWGLTSMLFETEYVMSLRLQKIRYGMNKKKVQSIMGRPRYTMSVGKKGSPKKSVSWSYYNKKESCYISFNAAGRVSGKSCRPIKKKK
ncbi:hypothetical protein ACFL20_10285 [Spirochaetota bacterium]